MGENSAIQWTHHTFNPWRGCTKVSAGCDHCYAEVGSKRNPKVLGVWGDDGTRVIGAEAYWREPIRWNREAIAAGERRRVFCASLADVGEDRPDLVAPRARLCEVIDATPALIWMLLTKRPENMARLFPEAILRQCGVGTTTENQPMADARVPLLLRTPAGWWFISAEPLLGEINLRGWGNPGWVCGQCWEYQSNDHEACRKCGATNPFNDTIGRLDWVICGGESGHGARPMHPDWARSLRDQCVEAGVKFFFKQWGEYWPAGTRILEDREMVMFGDEAMYRVGKKNAGRLLDGREWNEFPTR